MPTCTSPVREPHLISGRHRRVCAGPIDERSLIVCAAACAALPLRSAPDDAAVAEVFGTLLVSVVVTRMALERHAELRRDDLRDLGVQALPHLCAAVIQQHRAVGVDVHQRAGLVVQTSR